MLYDEMDKNTMVKQYNVAIRYIGNFSDSQRGEEG
jgi:hypothetical protein